MIAYWIAVAGLLFLVFVHLAVGEKEVVRPLLASREFKDDVKYVLFLCWHLVNLVMAVAAAGYVAAALSNVWKNFALAGTILIALLALWSFTVVIWKRQRHRDMPQWIAFAAVALLGLTGHVTTGVAGTTENVRFAARQMLVGSMDVRSSSALWPRRSSPMLPTSLFIG